MRAERSADAFGGGGGGGGRGGARRQTYSPGGSEDGYIAPDPRDPDIFYSGTNANGGGSSRSSNRRTGEVREVSPYPRMFSGEESAVIKERWQWTYPIIFSPVDPKTSLRRLAASLEDDERRTELGPHQPRSHAPRSEDDGTVGRPDHARHERPGGLRGDLRDRPSKRTTNVIWTGSDDGIDARHEERAARRGRTSRRRTCPISAA